MGDDGGVTCDECGFDHAAVPEDGIAAALRAVPGRFRERLDPFPAAGRRRPAPGVWSAVEYACHVRDVVLVQRERAIRTLVEDVPSFPPMHRDERVALAGYGDEDPAAVVAGLEVAADLLARVFERAGPEALARRCVYNFPAPAERTLAWVGRHTLHEAHHHLADVDRVLACSS